MIKIRILLASSASLRLRVKICEISECTDPDVIYNSAVTRCSTTRFW